MARYFQDSEQEIAKKLRAFSAATRRLVGIEDPRCLDAFVQQITSSVRRIEFVRRLGNRPISPDRANPQSDLFDPLRAAIHFRRNRQADEATWLVFLATHFGKHAIDGWRLTRDIYGAFGQLPPWTWHEITEHRQQFQAWVRDSLPRQLNDGISRRFSNHRKYESRAPAAIERVLLSYVDLVSAFGTHRDWVVSAHTRVGQNPVAVFDLMYDEMDAVARFGRLAKFDFLTMIGKLDLMPIFPGKAYLKGATGPLRGARLLVDGNPNSRTSEQALERILAALDQSLNVGMQVLEDSMCNWQKSPDRYVYFRG